MAKNQEGFRISTTVIPRAEALLSLLLQSDDDLQNNSELLMGKSESYNNDSLVRSRPALPIETLRETIDHLIIPIVCLIGILGNGFNFYVFYCRWYQKFMNDAEKSVTVGLMTLSLSDAMFCLAAVPGLFLYAPLAPRSHSASVFYLHYKVYRPFFSNLFLLNSTWLIVTISLQRLVAVSSWSARCRHCVTDPLKTAIVHGAIFLAAFLVCFPLLLRNSVMRDACFGDDGVDCYYVLPSETLNSSPFRAAYQVLWGVFGTLLPLVLLTASNVRLIAVLCHGRYSEGLEASEPRHRAKITVLVVAMIVSFLVLVCPSMIVECLVWIVKRQPPAAVAGHWSRFAVAVAVTNLLQAIKFSFDFLLYCTVSKQFRREFKGCSRVNDSCRANRADQGVGPERCRLDGGGGGKR